MRVVVHEYVQARIGPRISPMVLDRGDADGRRNASPARDPLYLFACHLEWHQRGNSRAYSELLAALDDPDREIRLVAEMLLDPMLAAV
jgi:hypothetical protein